MATDLTIKKGDTRDWRFVISDASSAALNLTGADVEFVLRWDEYHSDTYFTRNTDGTGSDFILISDAENGIVRITPTVSDWADLSDSTGVFVGEFKITDSSGNIQFTTDVTVNVMKVLVP